jgi:hypothetical protein
MLARRPLVHLDDIKRALFAHQPADKAHLYQANLHVLEQGYQAAAPWPHLSRA